MAMERGARTRLRRLRGALERVQPLFLIERDGEQNRFRHAPRVRVAPVRRQVLLGGVGPQPGQVHAVGQVPGPDRGGGLGQGQREVP